MVQRSPRFRYYVAGSVDGFIATPDGGIEWLHGYDPEKYGIGAFMKGVGAIVMGRTTYEQVRGFGEWMYPGKRVVVLSSREVEAPPAGVERWGGGVRELVEELKRTVTAGDVWLMGGAKSVRGFFEMRAVDEVEVYVIPVLLGAGVPLVETGGREVKLELKESHAYDDGVVRLVYRVR